MQVVELFVKHARKYRSDKLMYEAVILILPDSGFGECYLEVIRRYTDREQVISPDRASPETIAVYKRLEADIGRNPWMRTLTDESA